MQRMPSADQATSQERRVSIVPVRAPSEKAISHRKFTLVWKFSHVWLWFFEHRGRSTLSSNRYADDHFVGEHWGPHRCPGFCAEGRVHGRQTLDLGSKSCCQT